MRSGEQSFRKIDLRSEDSQYECPRLCEREHPSPLPGRRCPLAALNRLLRAPDFTYELQPAESDSAHYKRAASNEQSGNEAALHASQTKISGSVKKPVATSPAEENRSCKGRRKCRC